MVSSKETWVKEGAFWLRSSETGNIWISRHPGLGLACRMPAWIWDLVSEAPDQLVWEGGYLPSSRATRTWQLSSYQSNFETLNLNLEFRTDLSLNKIDLKKIEGVGREKLRITGGGCRSLAKGTAELGIVGAGTFVLELFQTCLFTDRDIRV